MDRKTAIVLVVGFLLMIAAGVGMLVLMRRMQTGPTDVEAPEGLLGSYLDEVEDRCGRTYGRPVPGRGAPIDGNSSGYYLEAVDRLPDLGDEEWTALTDAEVDSWNDDSAASPVRGELFVEATDLLVEGAHREGGRSPYAFCAIDTEIDVFGLYRRLSRGAEILAMERTRSGDEPGAVDILSSVVQMEIDLGRGGGLAGHALSTSMVEETTTGSLAAYAGVACDEQALSTLLADLQQQESNWLDFGDNVRLDGLVEETLYASCYMPHGWDPPVGAPVITQEQQDTICQMGPGMIEGMWRATRKGNERILEAMQEPGLEERRRAIARLDEEAEKKPVWKKLLSPGETLAEISHAHVLDMYISHMRGLTYLSMARALVAVRLLQVRTGDVPAYLDDDAWGPLDPPASPLLDPRSGERFVYTLDEQRIMLMSPSFTDDGSEPTISTVLHPCPSVESQP